MLMSYSKVMPDSTMLVMTGEQELVDRRKRFKRFYICSSPLKKGFRASYIPLLGLDGFHLKGPYGGQLLVEVGIIPMMACTL